jgi:hypothetical protein
MTGVYFEKKARRWRAQIYVAGSPRYLGRFDTQQEAERMWDHARVILAEYFQDPWDKLNGSFEEIDSVPHEVELVRKKLEEEDAPTYFHSIDKATADKEQFQQQLQSLHRDFSRQAACFEKRLASIANAFTQTFGASELLNKTNP